MRWRLTLPPRRGAAAFRQGWILNSPCDAGNRANLHGFINPFATKGGRFDEGTGSLFVHHEDLGAEGHTGSAADAGLCYRQFRHANLRCFGFVSRHVAFAPCVFM